MHEVDSSVVGAVHEPLGLSIPCCVCRSARRLSGTIGLAAREPRKKKQEEHPPSDAAKHVLETARLNLCHEEGRS